MRLFTVVPKDPRFAKDPEMFKWCEQISKLMQDEVELRLKNLIIYGVSHPEAFEKEDNK